MNLSRRIRPGPAQYCSVVINIGGFCVGTGQKNVRARITCCK